MMEASDALEVVTQACNAVSCDWPTQCRIREALDKIGDLCEKDTDVDEDAPPKGLEDQIE